MSKQAIYDRMRVSGLSAAGALALMGNFDCESNLEPCRVQGDFSANRAASHAYADRVDNGSMSRLIFSGDAKGWGLAQWTFHTRKAALYDFCRWRSISIASEEAQVDFALQELRTEYAGLYAALRGGGLDDLRSLTERVCKEYEQPAVNNIDARYNAAMRLKGELQLAVNASVSTVDTENVVAQDEPTDAFWPPRVLAKGMAGGDVMALQGLLMARGYNCGGASGVLDELTHSMVMDFQGESELDADGIAGPKTWAALLSR